MAGVKEDLVEKHDIVVSKPMNFFLSTRYNTTFIEMRTDEIWPIPKDPYSDVYTFTHNGNNVGLLLKTNEAKISCEMSVRDAAGALQANSMLIPPPLPLRTLFKTKELKINESLVTPSDNSAHIIAWVSFSTRETLCAPCV